MTFRDPGALLWFLPIGAIIVALYLLRMRRKDVRVPASFLWPARTEEVRANALIQKLRPNVLLFLQLIALACAVLAFARPQTRQSGLAGEVTVLVLDTSASMMATDVTPNRFGEAKRLAEQALRSARPSDRIALIEAGPVPRVIFPLGSDTQKQLAALKGVEGTDSEADMGEAMRLASAVVGGIDGAKIVVLSDGVFDPIQDFSAGKAAITYKQIGKLNDNLAISALGLAETRSGRQLYVGIRNYGSAPLGGSLALYGDGKPIDARTVAPIGPGQTWGHTVLVPASTKVFEAKLDANDLLKADNYAAAIADSGANVRVLLVGKGDPFLERALSLDPRVTLDKTDATPPSGTERYDVVVFDGVAEHPVGARGVLTLGRAGEVSPVIASASVASPKFVSAIEDPLTRGVDMKNVYVDKMSRVEPRSYGRVIVQSTNGPWVVSGERSGMRQLYVAFDPVESDWPLQVSFPIFVANALDYLAGSSVGADIVVRPGAPFSIATETPLTIDGPDLKSQVTPLNSVAVVRQIRRTGTYSLTSDGKRRTAYAALRSERESNITPASSLQLGGGEFKAVQNPARFADFWRPLLMLCLIVLGAEWWVFARRS